MTNFLYSFLIEDRTFLTKFSMHLLKIPLSYIYFINCKNVLHNSFFVLPCHSKLQMLFSVSISIFYFSFSIDVNFLLWNKITSLMRQPSHWKLMLRERKDSSLPVPDRKILGKGSDWLAWTIPKSQGEGDGMLWLVQYVSCVYSWGQAGRMCYQKGWKSRGVAPSPPRVEGELGKDSWSRWFFRWFLNNDVISPSGEKKRGFGERYSREWGNMRKSPGQERVQCVSSCPRFQGATL